MPLPLNSLARPWSKPDDVKYDAAFCLSSNPLSSCEARRANMLPLLVDRCARGDANLVTASKVMSPRSTNSEINYSTAEHTEYLGFHGGFC